MQIIKVIEKYLSILDSDTSEKEAIENLMESLDELTFLSHSISFEPDDKDYPDPPEREYKETYDEIQKRFPSLGYYYVVDENIDKIAEGDVHFDDNYTGNAIEDIAKIGNDLKKVLWYFNNTSNDNALFHLKLLYSNWGPHLSKLQHYLHKMETVTLDDISEILSDLISDRHNIKSLAGELEDLIGNYLIDSSDTELVELIEGFGYDLAFYEPCWLFRRDPSLYGTKELKQKAKKLLSEIQKEIG